ncbi:MAG: aminopeptidase [Anaerolineales bacterium]|nr:aminopeptidase [Anaerolineales bacterium]
MDPRIQTLAKILVEHSARVVPGDRVAIEATTAAEPLVRALFQEILTHGGFPYPLLKFPEQNRELFSFGSDDQLSHVDQLRSQVYNQFESRIRIHSLTNPNQLVDFPPEKQTIFQQAQSPILATQMDRGARDEFKWVTTLFPTPAYAREAGMSLTVFEDFVYEACFADRDNPIDLWQQVKENQKAALSLFQGHDRIQLKGPNIDLELSVKDRTFINCFGTNNMPDGEIFTGPVEESLNGWVRYSYPAIYSGVTVKGVELTFKDGKVIQASAEEQEDYLLKLLDTDPGARYVGEFAVGMNTGIQQFSGNILFDEKIGGTIHIAIGAGYPETGSKNKSALHWDMICDMRSDSTITVDNSLVYQDGEFLF